MEKILRTLVILSAVAASLRLFVNVQRKRYFEEIDSRQPEPESAAPPAIKDPEPERPAPKKKPAAKKATKKRSVRQKKRKCQVCGTDISHMTARAKYCSGKCRKAAHDQRRKG